jgi:hypothetical protein
MRLGKSCRMVLVNCGMGLETVGWDRGRQYRGRQYRVELWDVPGAVVCV